MSRLTKNLTPIFARVRANIFSLCEEMNFRPTDQQAEALKLVQLERDLPLHERTKRIAVKSGQGPGKTTISVIVALWRAFQGVDAMVIVTAPTMRQCTDVWMAELRRRLHNAKPWLIKVLKLHKTRVIIGGRNDWGIKCVTATRPENMQGYHQTYLTFMLEEASGIARDIWEQIKGTLTNDNSLMFAIGNPNSRDSAFFDCFHQQRHMWRTLTFNAEDSPIVSKKNIQNIADEFGRNSDVFRVRVLGEFPDVDPNCVISQDDLEACTKTDVYECLRNAPEEKQIGIDFARFGSDESVIYRRSGNAIIEHRIFQKVDPGEVFDIAVRMQAEAGWKNEECHYVADAGGMGQGVMHRFYLAEKRIHEFHTAALATDPSYANKMTEAWFGVARLAKARQIYMPNDNRLIHQLCTRQYYTRPKDGKLIIETKDDYIKRQDSTDEHSPDRADGFVMAFYKGTIAQAQITEVTKPGPPRIVRMGGLSA